MADSAGVWACSNPFHPTPLHAIGCEHDQDLDYPPCKAPCSKCGRPCDQHSLEVRAGAEPCPHAKEP